MNQKTETFFYNERTMKGHLFHVKQFPLIVSERTILRTVKPGEKLEDSFLLRTAEDVVVSGFVSSSQPMVRVLTPDFSGAQAQIRYAFQAKGRGIGDRVEGYFRVISDQGEVQIPYTMTVDLALDEDGLPVRTLDRFVSFAEKEPEKALNLFYDRRFPMILKTRREYALYRGFSAESLPLEFGKRNAQNMEEFLVACGKKVPVKISVEQEKVEIRLSSRRAMDGNHILKNGIRLTLQGWGFGAFPVRTEGSFLSCTQDRILIQNFQNNDFVLPVEIERLRLHAGNNFGAVVIGTAEGDIRIPVTVRAGGDLSGRRQKYMDTQKTLLALVGSYEAFCTEKIGAQEWFAEMEELVRKLSSLTGNNLLVRLYRIHLQIVQRKMREAAEALDGIRKSLAGIPKEEVMELTFEQYKGEDDLLYSYRQYLTAICYHDEQVITPRVVRILQQRWRRNTQDWQIAWLLMDLSMNGRGEALSKYRFMRSLFENGCRSPLIYLEAFQLIKETPSLVNRESQGTRQDAGGFEVQVLRYAYRRNIMTAEVMHEVCVLAVGSRRFSRLLFGLLTDAYGQDRFSARRREILESICIMLVKHPELAEKWERQPLFRWIEEGIREEIPVTGLESAWFTWMPENYQGEIPEEVLLGLESPGMLSWPGRAYYYRYLYEHRYRYGTLYDRYKGQIGRFADEQRASGHRSPNLTFLYALCLSDPEISAGLSRTDVFIRPLFNVRVRTQAIRRIEGRSLRPVLPRAVLVYSALKGEQSFPMSENGLLFTAYSDHYVLYLVDQEGNRYRVPETDCIREYSFHDEIRGRINSQTEESARGAHDLTRFQNSDLQQALSRIREGGLFYRLNLLEEIETSESKNRQSEGIKTGFHHAADGNSWNRENKKVGNSEDTEYKAYGNSGNAENEEIRYPGTRENEEFGENRDSEWEELPPDMEAALREAAMDEAILPGIRREICERLLLFYIRQDRVKKDDLMLLQADPGAMTPRERGIFIKAFTRSGLEKKAVQWLSEYGTQGTEDETLLWAADALEAENGNPEIALEAVRRGKTDADMLSYLNGHFHGLLSEMEMVRKASEEVRLDVTELTGEMLGQMLFTGEKPENRIRLVEEYRRGGGKTDLVHACLAQFSYEMLSDDYPNGLFHEAGIGRDFGENRETNSVHTAAAAPAEKRALVRLIGEEESAGRACETISRLLFLKEIDLYRPSGNHEIIEGRTGDRSEDRFNHTSGNRPENKSGDKSKDRSAEQAAAEGKKTGNGPAVPQGGQNPDAAWNETEDPAGSLIRHLVSELLDEQAVMPFLRRYDDLDERLLPLRDVTMYTCFYPEIGEEKESHLVFHFAMEQQGERAPFSAKTMRRICDGLYAAGFVLFFGEQLHYFITDDEAEKNIIESGVLSQDAADMEGRSDRLALLNRIAESAEAGRQAEAVDQLKKYYVKNEITQYLFHYQKEEEEPAL